MKKIILAAVLHALVLPACATAPRTASTEASSPDDGAPGASEHGASSGADESSGASDDSTSARADEPRPAPAPAGDCVPEGGTAYTLHDRTCCPGLTFLISDLPPAPDGTCPAPAPGPWPGQCASTCGNGVCDGVENACNCSDC